MNLDERCPLHADWLLLRLVLKVLSLLASSEARSSAMIRTSLLLERRPLVQSPAVRFHVTRTSRRRRRSKKTACVRTESTNKQPPVYEPTILQPVAWYSRKLDTHPILTKCISSGFVSGSGDVLGQYIAYKRLDETEWNWDAFRTGRFAALGFALVAPICHVWYGSLMKRIPGSGMKPIAKRVFLDQFFMAPLFIPTWLLNLWMLEGKSPEYVLENMPHKVPPLLIANWQLWIPAQTINLGFVPGKYQVLFSNVVAVAWNTFLSLTTQDPKALEEEQQIVAIVD